MPSMLIKPVTEPLPNLDKSFVTAQQVVPHFKQTELKKYSKGLSEN